MLSKLITLVPLAATVVEASHVEDPLGLNDPLNLHAIVVDRQPSPQDNVWEQMDTEETDPEEEESSTKPVRPRRNPYANKQLLIPPKPAKTRLTNPKPEKLLTVPVWSGMDVTKAWLKMDSIADMIYEETLTLDEVKQMIPCTYAYAAQVKQSLQLYNQLLYLHPIGEKKIHDEVYRDVCEPYLTRETYPSFKLLESIITRMARHWKPSLKWYVKERRTAFFRSILVEAIVGSDLAMPYFVPGIIDKLDKMGLTDLPLNEGTVRGLFDKMPSVEVRLRLIYQMLERLSNSPVLSNSDFERLKTRVRAELVTRRYLDQYEHIAIPGDVFVGKLRVWDGPGLADKIKEIGAAIEADPQTFSLANLNAWSPCLVSYMLSRKDDPVYAIIKRQWSTRRVTKTQNAVCQVLFDNLEVPNKADTSAKLIAEMARLHPDPELMELDFSPVLPERMTRISERIVATAIFAIEHGSDEKITIAEKETFFHNILREIINSNYPIPYWRVAVVGQLITINARNLHINQATVDFLRTAIDEGLGKLIPWRQEEIRDPRIVVKNDSGIPLFDASSLALLDAAIAGTSVAKKPEIIVP